MLSSEDHPLHQDVFHWFYRQEYLDIKRKYRKKLKRNSKRLFLKKWLHKHTDRCTVTPRQGKVMGFIEALFFAIF